jgi:maltooligosyltrehalose trehalohydrolase
MDSTGVWADDFHHAVRVALTGEREGYYKAYSATVDTVARTIGAGWLYTGQTYAPSGERRGKACAGLSAENLVYCIQNHDQIGNRALGDRLTAAVSVDAYCVASTVLLFLPMTPLLFMGQEWGASTPFQFFTDHEPELGRLVSEGRRQEFKDFKMFASAELRAKIPDPQAPQTFERSRLDWGERERRPHSQILRLYTRLIRLRAEEPVMREAGRKALDVRVRDDVLFVRRWKDDGARLLVANFGHAAVDLQTLGPLARRHLLFNSADPEAGAAHGKAGGTPPKTLPGHTALILS